MDDTTCYSLKDAPLEEFYLIGNHDHENERNDDQIEAGEINGQAVSSFTPFIIDNNNTNLGELYLRVLMTKLFLVVFAKALTNLVVNVFERHVFLRLKKQQDTRHVDMSFDMS